MTERMAQQQNNRGAGGYKYELVNIRDEEKSKCQICFQILREPKLTSCCGQHYCSVCFDTWMAQPNSKKCPYGCQEDFQAMKDLKFKREVIDILLVKCPNRSCKWQGKLLDAEQHVLRCNEEEVECDLGCGVKLQRKKLETHIECECTQRMHECKFCHYKATLSEITGTEIPTTDDKDIPPELGHYAECPEYPKSYSNKCGKVLKRRELAQHTEVCPKEKIICTNMAVNPTKVTYCNASIERQSMNNHLRFECLYRKYNCELCGLSGTYTEITGEDSVVHYDPGSHDTKNKNPPPQKGHYAQCPEYPILCPKSCGETIKRKDIEHHRTLCSKENVTCKNWKVKRKKWGGAMDRCGEVMERDWLHNHLTHECLYRNYRCTYCEYEDKYTIITGVRKMKKYNPLKTSEEEPSPDEYQNSHYSVCKKYPVLCPNGCQNSFPREDILLHRETCPLEVVPCPFQSVCCQQNITRKKLSEHVSANQSEHLTGLLHAYTQMQKDVEAHKKSTTEELKATKKRLEQTERDLKSTKYYFAKTVHQLNTTCHQTAIKDALIQHGKSERGCQEELVHLSICLHYSRLTMNIQNFTLHGTTGVPWQSPNFHIHFGQSKWNFNVLVHPQFSQNDEAEYQYKTALIAVECESQPIPLQISDEDSNEEFEFELSYQKTKIKLTGFLKRDKPKRATLYHELKNISYDTLREDCLTIEIEMTPRSRQALSISKKPST